MSTERANDGPGMALQRRGRLLRVRVRQTELERWRAAAAQQGVNTLSRWLRALADQAAACGEDPLAWRRDLAGMLRDLNAGVGNNLNQIARGVAMGKFATTHAVALERLAEELAGLRGEIRAHLLGRPAARRRARATKPPAGGAS